MEVYLDILILENIVVNYLILWTSGKLSKIRTTNLRLFLGALVGALYAAFMIIRPDIKIFYTVGAKILLSAAMVAIAFVSNRLVSFLKALILFYISTFVFAGASFALIYLNSQKALIRNGMVHIYWQSKWITVLYGIFITIIVLGIFQELIQYRITKENLLIKIKIKFEGKYASIAALIDTGNSLYDPLSNMPVIVVEFSALRDILPSEVCNIFEDSMEIDFSLITKQLHNSKWLNRFRLIPFSSLGRENGMLIGFKPDFVEVGDEEDPDKKGISNVIIGICKHTLSKGDRYRALLSPDLV